MKRRLVKLVVFLLLSAIVNVAVAWGLEAFRSPTTIELHGVVFTARHARLLAAYAPPRMSASPQFAVESRDCRGERILMTNGEGESFVRVFRQGWPVRSLEGAEAWDPTWRATQTRREHLIAPSWLRITHVSHLCARPIWPGFATNTVFYAVILWLLFAAPFALRRRIRIRRGLCPSCAYPVGASNVCSECGKPVKGSS